MRVQVQIKPIQVCVRRYRYVGKLCVCVCTRQCLKERDCGNVSGRPVSYNTPLCGRVGAELSVGQVNRDYRRISEDIIQLLVSSALSQLTQSSEALTEVSTPPECRVSTFSNTRTLYRWPSLTPFYFICYP